MQYSFVVIGNQKVNGVRLEEIDSFFPGYTCAGLFHNDQKSIEEIMRIKPQLIFFNVENDLPEADITFTILSEMLQYLKCIPYVMVLSETKQFALEAIQSGMSDYLTDIQLHTLGKSLSRFEKKMPLQFQQSICIKSYSDYQFIKYNDIVYLKADNNSTDFRLCNGRSITAYKTLKHFEQTLPHQFVRIHKSYIVNIHYVSRIQLSKSKCYLDFNEQIPFSNTYREAVEHILSRRIIDS